MAKAKNNVNKIFKEIQKNAEAMGVDAMQSAANEMCKLAKEKAVSCMKMYYAKKPKIYKRTKSLRKAFGETLPVMTVDNDDKCVISFYVNYNASKLEGLYKSNSWYHKSGEKWISRFDFTQKFNSDGRDNGIPSATWILDNYMKGIHPGWYNGVDRGWKDDENTEQVMQQFFEKELKEKASELIGNAMRDAVVNYIKTNGGGR